MGRFSFSYDVCRLICGFRSSGPVFFVFFTFVFFIALRFFEVRAQDLCVPFRPICQLIFFPDCTNLTKPFSWVFFFALWIFYLQPVPFGPWWLAWPNRKERSNDWDEGTKVSIMEPTSQTNSCKHKARASLRTGRRIGWTSDTTLDMINPFYLLCQKFNYFVLVIAIRKR